MAAWFVLCNNWCPIILNIITATLLVSIMYGQFKFLLQGIFRACLFPIVQLVCM